MLVDGEEAPRELKLVTVDNGLVREYGCQMLPVARCSALTLDVLLRAVTGGTGGGSSIC